jgi:hypothetical protein
MNAMSGNRIGLLSCFLLLGCASVASAQRSALEVTPAAFSFPSADPDTTPVIDAPPLQVHYRVTGNPAQWMITVRAQDALTSGMSTIDVSNESWTATPAPPFNSGTLSTMDQTLAQGTGNAHAFASVTFSLRNSWNYSAGTYSQTLIFTLVTP